MDMPVGLRDGTSNRGSADGARISTVADTGAQSDLWSLEEFLACGFARDDLRPVSLSLSAANHSPIAIEGAFFARLSTTCSGGRVTSCRSMVYVSSSVRAMYLSYESLLNLSLLPVNFPSDDVAGGPKDRRSPDTADTPDQPLSGIAQRPADRPRDSAMGASPPAPADEASPDLTVPTGAFLGAPLTVPQSSLALPQPTRPGRARRPPARYEPESGSWIRDLDR
ncbi:hypothetical protein F7725_028328 [Dissostichus mawsoni]|uniref:Uncharacterized protein n=1 Tax=Dissostichus mawsoni TaxID=36200 RepID=A0A7J5XFP3_DISMA|nr:hypothetical protein F7725_028328 [Dissostichus mawsoni]